MDIHVGDEGGPDKASKLDLFVARPSKTYQNLSNYDATDLSNINLGVNCYFVVVDKFCYKKHHLKGCKDTLHLIHRIRKARKCLWFVEKLHCLVPLYL